MMPYPPLEHCRAERDALRAQVEKLEIQLAAADEGLLKAIDPDTGWLGITAECKEWMSRARTAMAERDALRGRVEELEAENARLVGACIGDVASTLANGELRIRLEDVETERDEARERWDEMKRWAERLRDAGIGHDGVLAKMNDIDAHLAKAKETS